MACLPHPRVLQGMQRACVCLREVTCIRCAQRNVSWREGAAVAHPQPEASLVCQPTNRYNPLPRPLTPYLPTLRQLNHGRRPRPSLRGRSTSSPSSSTGSSCTRWVGVVGGPAPIDSSLESRPRSAAQLLQGCISDHSPHPSFPCTTHAGDGGAVWAERGEWAQGGRRWGGGGGVGKSLGRPPPHTHRR